MSNANIKVLIIDDIDSIKKITRPTLINQLGFSSSNIIEATNGRKALETLNTEHFDLVLCEWNIPEISGIDLLKIIRKNDTLSALPFIMVTANSDQRYILEAAEEKVSQYVIKPFTVDSFSHKLNLVLRSKNLRKEKRHQVTRGNELIVLSKGKPFTSGTITNISKGGLLAKLLIQRGITIYDRLDLKISLSDSSSGKNFVNSVHGELVRIEQPPESTDNKTGYYAFKFINVDHTQQKFLETLTLWIEQKTANHTQQ